MYAKKHNLEQCNEIHNFRMDVPQSLHKGRPEGVPVRIPGPLPGRFVSGTLLVNTTDSVHVALENRTADFRKLHEHLTRALENMVCHETGVKL